MPIKKQKYCNTSRKAADKQEHALFENVNLSRDLSGDLLVSFFSLYSIDPFQTGCLQKTAQA